MKLETGSYQSPRWSWEILDCAMPMTFDTYSNCAHQCVYCFAYFQRAVGDSADDYLHHKVRSVNVEKVKRMFTDPDEHAGQFAWYIKQKRTMQWGGLSDGFDWYERKFRKSLELLRFFVEIGYPVSISTKGVWWLYDEEYRDLLRAGAEQRTIHLKITIITDDEKKAKVLEAGTPTPDERYRGLETASELGVVTTLRFRPYILGVSDLCDEAMLRRAKDVGCYSATTEFLCVEGRSSTIAAERFERIGQVAGYDVYRFYRLHSASRAGLLRLNYDLKRPHIRRMQAVCEEIGLKFFVSDAHHKEAGCGSGCCGLPDEGPLGNSFDGHFGEAVQIAKRNGQVMWSDIAQEAENLKAISFYRAEGYNAGSTRNRANRRYQTMYDYMRECWNNVDSKLSPAKHHGGAMVPTGADENGDVIYTYNRAWVENSVRIESAAELIQGEPKVAVFNPNWEFKPIDVPDVGKLKVIIPSTGRENDIRAHKHFPDSEIYIVVRDESEAARYRENDELSECTIVASDVRGIGATRQWSLDNLLEEGEWAIWCDDNVRSIRAVSREYYHRETLPVKEGGSEKWRGIYETICEPGRFVGEIVPEVVARAEEIGAYYAGFGSTGNYYFRGRKWREVGFVWVALSLVKKEADLRIDTLFTAMDDYQFTAEQLLRHGVVLINGYVWAEKKFYEPGGAGKKEARLKRKLGEVERLLELYPGLYRKADRANSAPGAEVRMRLTNRQQVELWRAGIGVAR